MNEMRLRNTKLDITGRSLILNIAAIVLNIAAVVLIVIGYHESTETGALTLRLTGFGLLALTLFFMIMLKGMFLFSFVARAFVGGLFIVSGLVKANDPWGFAFKLEEYFEPSGLAFDYPFFEIFHDYALPLSILICVAEIVLGAAVILGGKIKLASWALVIMMLFFTWLTWYTHSCNVAQMLAGETGAEFGRQCVTDCGCFGDALRGSVGRSLTPFESFWKDIVLFYFCLIIFGNQWKIKLNTVKENWIMVPASLVVVIFFSWVFGWIFPIFFTLIALLGAFIAANLNIGKIGKAWKMAIFVTFLSLLFSMYTSNYLPFKDYRPYAVGNNLVEQMNNGQPQISDFFYFYENLETTKIDTVPMAEWGEQYGDTTKYRYVDYSNIIIEAGSPPSIQDFGATIDYSVLSEEEKMVPEIDSIIQSMYDNYYEEKMILSTALYGPDTISAIDYDTLYYPDSLYTVEKVYTDLMDPGMRFTLDLKDYLLSTDYVLLMTIRDMETMNKGSMEDFKNLYAGAKENEIPFYVLSPAGKEDVDEFKKANDFDATFLGIDGVEVKIIVRSNPGLILLNKGTVLDKWPSRSIEDFEDIYEEYINTKKD